MRPKHFLLCSVWAICIGLYAQTSDSLHFKRDKGLLDMQENRYVEAFYNLKYYIDNVTLDEKATFEYTQVANKYRQIIGQLTESRKQCYKQAETAKREGKQALLDSLCGAYLKMCVQDDTKETFDYTFILTQHAMKCLRDGNTEKCLEYLGEVLEKRRFSAQIDSIHMGETYNLMAMVESQKGNNTKAIELSTKARNLYEKRYGKKGEYYGRTLVNMANYHDLRNDIGDTKIAIEFNEEAIKILSKNDPVRAQAQNKLSVLYSHSNDFFKSKKYIDASNQSKRKVKNSGILDNATFLSNEAIQKARSNDFAGAIDLAKQAIEIFSSNGDTLNLNFARLLSNTAQFEKHMERYKDAIPLWEQAVAIFADIEGKESSNYLNCMSEISAAYAHIGETSKATDINESLQLTASSDGHKTDYRYALSLSHQAANMAGDGNYRQAIVLQQQALSIFHLRNDTADEANALNELSNYLYHTGRQAEAIDSCKRALSLYEKIPGHEELHAIAMNSLSIYYYNDRHIDSALIVSRRAVEIFEKSGISESSTFSKILTNLSLYEAASGNIEAAITICQHAESMQSKVLGELHPDNVVLQFNLANYFLEAKREDDAQHYFHKALSMQMQHVRSNFSHLSTSARELYWETKNYVFRSALYLACGMETNDSTLIDAYNALLFTKGLLLNSEIDFNNLLSNAPSQKIKEKYERFILLHNEIDAIWRNPTAESRSRIPQLFAEQNRLERELMKDSKEFGDFTESMTISFPQIAKSLKKDEAAIEFFDIISNSGDHVYWALLARSGQTAPKLIRLFSNTQLDAFQFQGKPLTEALNTPGTIGTVYEDPDVGSIVWAKLVESLDDVKTIYFAPTGLFYQWGIEYLSYAGNCINERYDVHRVSSTKTLARRDSSRSADKIKRAAIFGGLDYDATSSDILASNSTLYDRLSELTRDHIAELRNRNLTDSLDMAVAQTRTMDAFLRNGQASVGYLAGTDAEADYIGECLMMNEIISEMYKGSDGTEEAFKTLSGRDVSLLHIATHGFSFSPEKVSQNSDALAYLNAYGDPNTQANNSLCYSGLLMSGANNILKGKPLPEGTENGVLTAYEIAKLDLRGLNLAVLSACQTGLGELKEDGVFGLQRGFKKAGVHTLLMSLWEIDDTATQLLMVEFYRALLDGNSPTQSFHQAQNVLRNNPKYSSPFYWASFIILDDVS